MFCSFQRESSARLLISPIKAPFCRYAGLDRANAERIAKFEAETKAMLTQRSEVVNTRSSLAKSSSDLAEGGRGQHQGEIE